MAFRELAPIAEKSLEVALRLIRAAIGLEVPASLLARANEVIE